MVNKKRLVAITLAILMLVMECLSLFSCGTKVENFELSFNVDGENYATITTTGTETIQIPENPSKDGYTFDGWYWDKDVWSNPFTANSLLDAPISSDMSVYAKFTPIAYSISYEMDGGTHNNPATYTIESNFEFADAQKAGYTFLGWYTDANYTTQIKSISAGTTGDMTLYAKFELATYSITYENTKGADNTNPSTYTINSETITFSPLSKDGYTFGGWYVGDTKVMEISKGSTGNLTLTAKWDTIGYTITYHNVAGATHANPDSYDVEDQPLTLSAASKAGYRFVGWCTDEALTNMVTEIAIGTTGDLNLYAKWEIIEYTATFKDGGTVVGTVKFTVESDSITEPAVPEHTGYTGAWESYTLGTEDITINAVYTLITYNIVYHNVVGATNTNPSNYDVEDQPLALLDASKDYYTFKGWYTDAEFNNQVTEIAVGTTGIVNLYAKWEAVEYTATFMDGDTVVGTVKFTVESNSITEPAVPEHTGYTGAWENYTLGYENITINAVYTLITYGIVYHNVAGATNTNPSNYDVEDQPLALLDANKDYYTFKGWYTDAEFNNQVTEIAVGTTGVVNLYAKWEAIEYTATFMDGNIPVGTVKFTVETESIVAPAVPNHVGYTGVWESYTLRHEDITVIAVYTPITYTITYTGTKSAANSNVGTYTIESETITLTDPSAVGYTFDGWYNGDTKVTQIPTGSIGNLTLTAKWTAIKYSITYLYDHEIGDYADENKNPTTYTIEDEFVFIPLVNHTPGYTFDGWFTEKNNGTGDKVTGVALGTTGDITVYAQWGLENYTITYHNVNGATNTNAENYNVETETFNIEDISRIGYVFDGWYADAEFTTPASTTIVKGSTGNIDMYAKWTPIGYSITYILFGETVDDITNPDRYTIEDSFVLNNPTREGYVFVGWYTLNENGERVTEIKENTTGNKTFYARWIKFESNGGSAVSYTPVHSGNTISAPDAPTRAHYEFDGWYTNEESTQKYNFKPTESIILYAKWIPVEYEIEYILNGGTNSKDNPDTYTVEDKFELCAPDKVGYTFVGWFTDPEFTSTVVTEIKAGTSGKITLYAHYLINQYTISFESNGGTTVSAITQNYATDVTAPEAPAKNGYSFAGWYSDATLKNAYTFTTMPAEDITLYAKWNIVTYDITYNLDGGTNHKNNPSTYKITSADITLGTPTKTGYTFGGWYTDSACTQPITKIANGSFGDVELFAKWTATVYTVTYNMADGAIQSNATTYTIETNLLTLTNATLKGHTFNGWYSDESYTTPVTTIAGGAINDVVLYAKFTANTYNVWLDGDEEAKHTVSFDLNGAEGTVASQTVTPTVTLKYPTIPTRNEYVFAGWYDNAACAGAPYDFTAVVTKDTTLYAKWVKIENASLITINGSANVTLNGKTEHMLVFVPLVSGNITITSSGEYDTFGTLYNAEMVALIQNDDGAADGINFHIVYNVTAGETYYIGARAFSSTTTGSATVSISGNTTVLDGGYAITTSQTPITYGTSFTLTLPDARDGYKFLGYADKDGVMYTDANGNSIKNWDKDEDTILYSVWEIAVYTVTLKTDASTVFAEIELPYGVRLDLSQYKPTMAGRVFVGWMYEGSAYNATTMPDYDIILTAQFSNYTLSLKIDEGKTAISVNDAVNGKLLASLFNASAVENVTGGTVPMEFECTVSGTIAAGETITVIIQNTENKLRRTITGIKVYGMPTLTFDDTVDYFNINCGLTASHFGASGTDTFGASTEIKVYVDGDYKAGDLVKIVIESIDPAGNITYGYIENVKAYGLPEIAYNENKAEISVNDTLSAELFGATAHDNFGEALAVTVSKYSGTIAAGRTVTIRISVTDSKGNVTNIDVQCRVYGAPTISEATKTDVRADDIVTPELLGITGTDTYGNPLTVTLTTKEGAQTAGTVCTVTATVTDAAGNVTTKDFELKVYGTPTISYDREGVKITEDATIDSYTVSFDLNGGSGTIASQTITNTIGLIYPEIPTRSGYVFTGWYTTADCTTLLDFSANVARNITVYAGWHQITTAGYGNYVMNVIGDNNSSSDYYSISMQGTSSSNAKYTYFTVLKDGTYKLYYKNGSSSTSYRTYMYVYNATQGAEIKSNTYISSTSYSYIAFTVKAGDVIYVRNYRYSTGSSSYYSTFYMYVTGANTPTAGGMAGSIGATGVLNAIATDSFGNPLMVTAKLSENCTFAAGNYVTYELTATDHLGNTYTLTTAPIGVYDVNDIDFTYSPNLSTIIKETSKGEEFNASATDSFGNACDITIEAAEGYTLEGGKIISLYIIATDKAGNRVVGALNSNGDPIPNIKVYGMPTMTVTQSDLSITESTTNTDVSFWATVKDSFGDDGDELFAEYEIIGEQIGGNTVKIKVTATDYAGNVFVGYIENVKVYGKPTISYNEDKTNISVNDTIDAALFTAMATDSFGSALDVTVTLKSGTLNAGSNVVYTLTAIDYLGNTQSVDVTCKVYGMPTISDATTLDIKVTDAITPELIGITATDTYGESITVDLTIKSGTQTSGKTMTITAGVTDNAGNVSTRDFEISVYGLPVVTLNQDNRAITESTDIVALFTVHDSFGEVLPVNTAISGQQIAGNTIVVTVTATDDAGNIITKQYTFGVLPCEKHFVELYVDGELWQAIFVDDASNYSLPVPMLDEGFESVGWLDKNGDLYSSTDGIGLIELTETIQLYYGVYKTGYSPIYTVEQLKTIPMDGKYCLVIDLDLNGTEWTPIGTASSPFLGVFDGLGHKISNLKISTVCQYEGVFGYSKGTIQNIGIINLNINVTLTPSTSGEGKFYVGGLVGYNAGGTINNCSVTGDITVKSSYKYTGPVSYIYTHIYSYVGALVGTSSGGTISNSCAKGSVSASSSAAGGGYYAYAYVGGLLGSGGGTISNCYATSEVTATASSKYYYAYSYAGGLVGSGGGIISNCYATGNVSATSSSSHDGNTSSYSACAYAGGLVGYKQGNSINCCYALGNVYAQSSYSVYSYVNDVAAYAGGLIGCNKDSTINASYSSGNASASTSSPSTAIDTDAYSYVGGFAGYNSGDIGNCYASGNVSATANCPYGETHIYRGSLVGYNYSYSGNVSDCYYCDEQEILQVLTFHINTIGWNSEIWNFVNGEHPTLKNVGAVN